MESENTLVEDIELENGTVIAVEFLRKWNHVIDPNYGADADGNRGCVMEFIEDDSASDIVVNVSRAIPLDDKKWKSIKAFREKNQGRIEYAIDKWLTKNDPTEGGQ